MSNITVTLELAGLQHLSEVADDLRSAGMHVDQVLDTLGVITGSAPEGAVADIAAVSGVGSVDLQRVVRIEPPSAAVQ